MKKSILLILVLCLFYPVIGSATTMVQGLTETVGYAGMNGMEVTVTFGDAASTSETEIWGTSGFTSGSSGVIGTDWSLIFTVDDSYPETVANQWHFQSPNPQSTNSPSIKSIEINALLGNTVFDILNAGNYYTEGSFFGYWEPTGYGYFGTETDPSGPYTFGGHSATWTFSDDIQVLGAALPAEQDVYGTLTIEFDQAASNLDFSFTLDSDHVVPEPTTMLLFGLGLLGFSAVSRKKQMA